MSEPSDTPKHGIIWNPPEGRDDEATLIARLCAVPAPAATSAKKPRSEH